MVAASLYAHAVHSADRPSTVGIGVLAATIALAARGPDWDGVLPGPVVRAVHWLAGVSYGVFLLNQEIGYVLMYQVHRLGGGALPQVAAMVTGAVMLGWLLTRLVEVPAHRVLTGQPTARPAADGQAQAGSVGSAGRSQLRPFPVPRPVSQPSMAFASPYTDATVLVAAPLTCQLR